MSPPTREGGAPPPRERPASEDASHRHGAGHAPVADGGVPQQLRRRRAASWRCPPLVDGRRDPLDPVHPDTWTDAELESWAAAAVHLQGAGLHPVLPASLWYLRRPDRWCTCTWEVA